MPTADAPSEPRELALLVHRRLAELYGAPVPFFHHHDPLSELVSALLSHRTLNAHSGRAFRALKAQYADWSAVRDAPVEELEAVVADCTWPDLKALRLMEILAEVTRRRGELSLEFLRDLPVVAARAWLEELPGVGPKTSAAVLLFSDLRMPAMPVDSHHHRVALRLGLIPPRTAAGPAHARLAALLPPDWGAQDVYDHHELLMFHGQRCCFDRKPACGRCVLLDVCPTGQAKES